MPVYSAVTSMGTLRGHVLKEAYPMLYFTLMLEHEPHYGIALAELKSADEPHYADLYITMDIADKSVTMGPYPLDYDEMKLMKQMVPFPSQIMGEKSFITIKVGKKS